METKLKPGELPLNVYHYVIGNPNSSGLYLVYGPFKAGGRAPHQSELDDMDKYY